MSFLVDGSFLKKMLQKLLFACLSLLITKFFKCLNSLYVSLSGFFCKQNKFRATLAIKFVNSCVSPDLVMINVCDRILLM